jgi:hypothetical protein
MAAAFAFARSITVRNQICRSLLSRSLVDWAIESREWWARGEDESQLSSDTGQYHAGITAAPNEAEGR